MANGDNNEQQPNQQQMLQDFSALPDAEKQKVLAALPEGHILRDFAALPSGEQQKVLNPSATAANATRSDNPNVPLVTPQPGESFEDTMNRAVAQGKQTTPQDISQSMKGAGKKALVTLAAAPLSGPALLTTGAIAPEAASTAVGGGITGGAAAGVTAGAGGELLRQAVTGENPASFQGIKNIGIAGATGAVSGGLLAAGGKLLSPLVGKASDLWDLATGYRSALKDAQDALELAKTSYPAGAEGEWAKTNEILGVQQKALRVSQDASKTYGNAGRGLATEGLNSDQLQQMKPNDIVRAITPRLQAAGKAVQATVDEATAKGITLDAGNTAHDVIKNIKDPELQEKAIDMFNQHTRDLGIYNTREMTPSQALQLRQALRNDANFNSLQPGIGTKLYRAVSNDLHTAVPDLVPVDMHYGDLTSAMTAAQRQTSRYLIGKWTPPQTRIDKALAEFPERGDYTNPAILKIGAAAGLGSGLVGAGKILLNNVSSSNTTP